MWQCERFGEQIFERLLLEVCEGVSYFYLLFQLYHICVLKVQCPVKIPG